MDKKQSMQGIIEEKRQDKKRTKKLVTNEERFEEWG